MTEVVHPALATAKIIGDRIADVMGDSAKVFVEDLNVQKLSKRASGSELTYIVVSPEEVTRTVASRRRIKTGSAQFSIEISVSKHIGEVKSGDFDATKAFFDSIQKIIDAAMGVDDAHPDGQDISLPAPWGIVRWPEEVTEVPADQELSAMSLRFRTTQFKFQASRGG